MARSSSFPMSLDLLSSSSIPSLYTIPFLGPVLLHLQCCWEPGSNCVSFCPTVSAFTSPALRLHFLPDFLFTFSRINLAAGQRARHAFSTNSLRVRRSLGGHGHRHAHSHPDAKEACLLAHRCQETDQSPSSGSWSQGNVESVPKIRSPYGRSSSPPD